MRRFLLCFSGFLLLFCVASGLWLYTQISTDYRTFQFYRNGTKELNKVHEYSSDDNDYTCIMLPSNEWYVFVLEHECCSGAGFSAVLVKDSSGKFYSGEENFCSDWDLVTSAQRANPQNLTEFHEQLLTMGFRQGLPWDVFPKSFIETK